MTMTNLMLRKFVIEKEREKEREREREGLGWPLEIVLAPFY
jgi:hypothetical protein